MSIDLRPHTSISYSPKQPDFGTVSQGYHPLEGNAALFIEVSPGMDINLVTDALEYLCQTRNDDRRKIRCFGVASRRPRPNSCRWRDHHARACVKRAIVQPRIVSAQTLTGIEGYQSQLVNRMRHGNFLLKMKPIRP